MMKSVRSLVLIAAVAAAAPLASEAQEGREPRGAMSAGRMDGRLVQLLERHRAELGLSAEQVARIERIETRLREQNQPLLEQLRAARPQREGGAPAERTRELSPEERQALRARMQALRPVMRQVRENSRAAMQEVRDVLTAEQRERARELMREGREERRRDRPRMGRRDGWSG